MSNNGAVTAESVLSGTPALHPITLSNGAKVFVSSMTPDEVILCSKMKDDTGDAEINLVNAIKLYIRLVRNEKGALVFDESHVPAIRSRVFMPDIIKVFQEAIAFNGVSDTAIAAEAQSFA